MKSFVGARTAYQCLTKCAAWLSIIVIMGVAVRTYGQCSNTTLFPATPVIASAFNDTVVISTSSNAGQYFQVKNMALVQNYVFIGNAGDYITLRDPTTNAVLGAGAAPYTYATGAGQDAVNVHLNLASPACGTDATPRTTKLVCSNCPSPTNRVGINQPNPQASLDVAGEIKLGDAVRPPQAGMVRWNPATKDFEGYNGTQWLSLTRANAGNGGWGQVSAAIQENVKLTALDSAANDYFGNAVSIDGDYAIVGSFYDDIGAKLNQGSAFIFVRSGSNWIQQAKLTASDGAAGDLFGWSVGISRDYAIVGAAYDTVGGNDRQGSAYVFVRSGTTWTQQAKLTATDGAAGDQFGVSVSIDGDYALVGAWFGEVDNRGYAYVFVRNGTSWTQQAKLTASDAAAGDTFGTAVSISGNYALIGAPWDDTEVADDDRGSAYLFVRNGTTWGSQVKLLAADRADGDNFGTSVSINGDNAVIGAPYDVNPANGSGGSAYVFVRNGALWQQQPKIIAGDVTGEFGIAVSISGDYMMIGAGYSYESRSGASFVFVRDGTGWSQQSRFVPSDRASYFGRTVSISSSYGIVGAYLVYGGRGAAYIISKN